MTQISSYFATVGVQVDLQSLKRVDTLLRSIEKRLQSFQNRVNKLTKSISISIDEKKFKSQFERASKSLPAIKLSKFEIDRNAIASAFKSVESRIPVLKIRTSLQTPSSSTISRVQGITSQRHSSPFSTAFGLGSGGGFGAGILMRAGPIGALAAGTAALGMYGSSKLGDLNERNQQVMQARSSLTNTLSAFNRQSEDRDWWNFLSSNADRLGINLFDQMPEISKSIANGISLGLDNSNLREQMLAQMEFGRANNMSQDQMRRFQLAWGQIQATGRLQGDEMNQMADSGAAGINGLFAQAWANITKSGLTGAAAMGRLLEDREKGKVTSDKILPEVAKLMRQRAAPVLQAASATSSAEQSRFNYAQSEFMLSMSRSGVESGFARIFNTLEESLQRIMPLAESIGKRFDSFAESISNVISRASEAFALFNDYASSLKTSLPPEVVAAIRSVGMGIESFGNAISNLHNHIQAILSSPLFQTIGKLVGGAVGHIANTVNSVGAGAESLSKGDVKQAGKELLGATPLAMLPWESPAEQRVKQDQERREQTAQQFSKFYQPASRLQEYSFLSDRTDMVVKDARERMLDSPMRVVGQTGGLPSVVFANQPSVLLPAAVDPLDKITALIELQNQQNAKAVQQPPNITTNTFNQSFSIQSTEPDGIAEEIKRVLSLSMQQTIASFPSP